MKKNGKGQVKEIPQLREDLFKKGMLVVIKSGAWGGWKKLDKGAFKRELMVTEKSERYFRATKQLVDRERFLTPILANQIRASKYVSNLSIPGWPVVGSHFVAKKDIPKVQSFLEKCLAKHNELVEELLENYEIMKEEAQKDLGPEFHKSEYPTINELKASFSLVWWYMVVDSPSKDSGILSSDMYNQETRRLNGMIQDFVRDSMTIFRSEFSELVSNFESLLVSGEPKRIKEPSVNKVLNWIERFKSVNISNDKDLEKEVKKLEVLIREGKVDAEMLRNDDKFREKIANKLSDITSSLGKLTEKVPSRMIITKKAAKD